ncbi:hypothetical protein DFQ28_011612 [Apophysomyces sp. BC1034]|nr:hypothetical protein DFQ30_011489 [Apophysomyces sp. BC1015]KAG0168793.1 hypothetical protein DFQ29_010014 [Apophysomyces sp. BC1021]KAG0184199.1 hypothetical protein DFQ28_011612 [Apophysomyces sp. BC1034]
MSNLPDFMTDANAVLNDKDHDWLYKRVPDYKKVNEAYEREKTTNHAEGSIEWLVSNLVKNWEKEMSYKLRGDQCRTIDHKKYLFSVNGQEKMTVDQMLSMGTYNALIGETELYSAKENDFHESHKLFKRALRTFSFEVLEVLSGPPVVTFKWRHWGLMVGDLSVKLPGGEKLEGKATNETISTYGITVARINDKYEIEELETFYDPNDLIRQMAKNKKDGSGAQDGQASTGPKCPFIPQ